MNLTSEPILDFGFAQSNMANSKIVAYATTSNQVILLPIDLTSESYKLTPEPSIPVTNVKRVAVYDQKLAYVTKGDVIHILNNWEFNPTRPTLTLSPPRGEIADLWFSEENLYVGLVDGTVLVYDSKSMDKRPIHTIGSNYSYIDLIRFNPVHQQFLIYSRVLYPSGILPLVVRSGKQARSYNQLRPSDLAKRATRLRCNLATRSSFTQLPRLLVYSQTRRPSPFLTVRSTLFPPFVLEHVTRY